MVDESLFISINPEEYKSNKRDLLNSKIDILNSMKNMHRLTGFKIEKVKLKIKLNELFSSLLQKTKTIEGNLPKPKLPKNMEEKNERYPVIEEGFIERIEKQDKIEQELVGIKEKLKELNG